MYCCIRAGRHVRINVWLEARGSRCMRAGVRHEEYVRMERIARGACEDGARRSRCMRAGARQ